MLTMNPYLNFAGNTRAALDFYKKIFNGEINGLQTFSEYGMGEHVKNPDGVMHAEFKSDGMFFMASDAMDDFKVHTDNNISLSLNVIEESEIDRIFAALANGGKVEQPLETAPWGAKFGMLTDKFGIHWLLNHYLKQ